MKDKGGESVEQKEQIIKLLEKAYGPQWKQIVQELGTEDLRKRVGKELTSFMAFPERGVGGDSQWRGNCSPEVIAATLKYVLECKRYDGKDISPFHFIDPMSGSGTSQSVADRFHIKASLYDLNPNPAFGKGNWNALKDDLDDSGDFIFLHPPYHSIIQYSGKVWGNPHKDDLSRCGSYSDFIEKLNAVIGKLFLALRKDGRLAVLVGDIRMKGQFHSIQSDMMKMGQLESFIVKAQYNCVSDNRTYQKPFIPVVTEYLLLFHKENTLLIPFQMPQENVFKVIE